MKALVIAERDEAVRELAAGARTMADEVVLATFDEAPQGVADKVACIAVPQGSLVDDAADTIIALFDAERPGIVLVEPTRRMKTIVGKLAAHAGTSTITDVMSFEAQGATSLYFGGVGERVQRARGEVAIYTVNSGTFADAQPSGTNAVLDVAWVAPTHPIELVGRRIIEKSGVDLFKADVVVAAGRGFAEEADLGLARALCDKVGGGFACSRPLTEGVNWLPTELYVGVSGNMLSPQVYVACGISGQMQHMVGCNRAATLFAINKDKNAPIFKQCDYGLIGDVKEVLPALTAAL